MVLLLLMALPVFVYFLFSGIVHRNEGVALSGAIPLVVMIVGMGFFWSYGIRITEKSVTLINQHMLKVFDYEDVIYINISFGKDSIFGEIKAKNQKVYDFCFNGIDLNHGRSVCFFPSLWVSGLRLTEKFVDKSIAKLSTCEKVKSQNLYAREEK